MTMWGFSSNALAGSIRLKIGCSKPVQADPDCSDDEVSASASRQEGLECPICCESFNMVENVPYVLWCGHTLCKNCVLGLQWALMKFQTLRIQLPLFISCPWCHLLSFCLVYKRNLMFPRKNSFLLWMVESMNGERQKPVASLCRDQPQTSTANDGSASSDSRSCNQNFGRPSQCIHAENANRGSAMANYLSAEMIHSSLCQLLIFFLHLTAKFPLVLIFLLIVVYAIPASAIVLALYILITILFAVPSFLILYFAYPSLDWLVREIIT